MKQISSTGPGRLASSVFPVVLLLLLAAGLQAQARWVRIENENKDISFAMPENYLVSTERTAYTKTNSVAGFERGVSFEVKISNRSDAKESLGRVMIDRSRNPSALDFELEGIPGKIVTYSDKGFEQSIYLASKKGYYVLQVSAGTKDAPDVGRFLRSIRVMGKPMVAASAAGVESEDETFSIDALQVSSEVKEALDRKVGKSDRKITFEPLSAFTPCRNDDAVRPAFVVSQGELDISSIGRPPVKSGDIRMNVQLLANGQVGDIVVFSDLDKSVLRAFADSARKARFVQAKSSGAPVDWCETMRQAFGVTTSTRIFTVPGE